MEGKKAVIHNIIIKRQVVNQTPSICESRISFLFYNHHL